LELFEVAQRHEVPLSRMAQRLVRENLPLVDATFQRNPEAAACLDRILSAEHRVTRSLMAMNEIGLLGAYWPEWEHIVCRWQHVIYHTYTVDVHSIFLVEELRRLWQGKHEAALPEMTELMRGVKDRTILFLGSLLHDVGKGRGGDHSSLGTGLARTLLERMGLAEERAERVIFLVQQHLRMSHLALRRDLSDPKLIVEFAGLVGDRINLRNLYLLTFADIRASSRGAWTEWKGQLLRELFERTAEYLEAGGDDPRVAAEQVEVRVAARKEDARQELGSLGVAAERIDAYFAEMPRRYFIAHTGPQIARHAMAMLSFRPEQVATTAVRSMRGDFSELIVVTRDVHGLYAQVAGAMTAKWVNILGAHVYTTRSGLALEIYRLTTPPGGPQELRELWRSLQETLRRVLCGEVDVRALLARRGRPLGETESPVRGPVEVSITNEESEFYTIADVTANDRLGLLYDLTHAVAQEGLEIYMSKASTLLDQVADSFYLKDAEGRKIFDPEVLERLGRSLQIAAAGDDA
jgi:[protein-PII] uridylyltransferase